MIKINEVHTFEQRIHAYITALVKNIEMTFAIMVSDYSSGHPTYISNIQVISGNKNNSF